MKKGKYVLFFEPGLNIGQAFDSRRLAVLFDWITWRGMAAAR